MAAPAAEPDWEASKENFQPLKTGRKAAALRDSTAELRTQAIEGRRRWVAGARGRFRTSHAALSAFCTLWLHLGRAAQRPGQ